MKTDKNSELYVIKLPKRTGTLEVIEEPTRIFFKIRFDKYGVFGDEAEIQQWLFPIFHKYETDTRPQIMDNPTTGEVAMILGDANNSIAIVKRGKAKQ